MSQFAIAALQRRNFGGSKGALYRETLHATGFYMGRVVIATAEFAPMPPSIPGYPGGHIPTAIGMRFLRHDGIYRSDVVHNQKPKPGDGTGPPPAGQPRTQVKERAGRITLFSSSAMSSGRLFLDRVARQQSPSPLIVIPGIDLDIVCKVFGRCAPLRRVHRAFLRSKHLVRRMLERASRCYELSPLALEAL